MAGVALFVVAMAVRLVHIWSIHEEPLFDTLMGDARAYDEWASRIAGGDWLGTAVFYQAPLYPYFLGLLYTVAGRDLLLVRIVQAAVGATSAVLLASAGARLFSRRVGLVAGFGLALYAPAIFFDGLLQKTVLDVFLVCLTIWFASRIIAGPSGPTAWCGLGLALGGLSLARENALLLVAVAAVWAVSRAGEQYRTGRTRSARRRSLTPVIALAAGVALVLLPVVARNYAVGGGFYLTTSQFGSNFYIGNNPEADGTYMSLRPGRGSPEYERQDATELAERALGRPLAPAEVSRYWTERSLRFITGSPGDWLQLMARKAALLVNAREMLDTESQETYEEYSPLLRMLAWVGHFGLLIPLAAIGLVRSWPDRRRLWPLYAMLVAYAGSVLLFFVFARYRFPLVPFLLVFAAAGILAAPAMFAATNRRQRLVAAAALLALVVLVHWPLLSAARMRAITETNLAAALHDDGRLEAAVERYRRAITLDPGYAPAYNNLGVTLRALGRVDEAITIYEQGLRLQDATADLHYNLANALLEQNRAHEAAQHLRIALNAVPGSAASHNNLGMALAAQGDYERAALAFRAAIAAEPGTAAIAHRNLGNVLASLGRLDEAVAQLERAVALDPQDSAASYDLGTMLLELQRFDEAAARFRAALHISPDDVRALNNLGIALASMGRVREAIPYFERALLVRPDFADARRNLDMAQRAPQP